MMSEENVTNGTDFDDDSQPPLMAFLALIMAVSCAGNSLLLYAVFHNRHIRHNVQSITIVNTVVVCLGDCLLNMSLVMGSLVSGSDWGFGDALCKWHGFVMNLVLVETVLLLTVLACDRFLAVKFLRKYDSLISPARLAFVILFTWVLSLAFSIPFCFDTVEMTFRPKLHTCSVSDNTPLAFICMASVLCFLAPVFIILCMFILICHARHKQQDEVKTIITQNHYSDQLMEEPRLWREMLTVKYVGVLCLLWFILESPYVITTYIQQYRFSSQLNVSVDYPWGVDVAFMWMRFTFSAVFPCATFICKKDLWHRCKECLVCHRSNSVVDIQVKVNPTSKPTSVKEFKSKECEQPRLELPNLLSFNVPVLFATSDGIHIETPHSDMSDPDETDVDCREHTLKGRQLDIGDQSMDSAQLPGDTSDYDSSTEAGYFVSQPLSAHHVRGSLETCSSPDLHTEEQNKRGTPSTVYHFGDSQGADSGLELSGTMNSSRNKDTTEVTSNTNEHEHHIMTVTHFGHKHGTVTLTDTDNVQVIPQSEISCRQNKTVNHTTDLSNSSEVNEGIDNIIDKRSYANSTGSNSLGPKHVDVVQYCAISSLPKTGSRLMPLPTDKKSIRGRAGRHTATHPGVMKNKGAGNVSTTDVTKTEQPRTENVTREIGKRKTAYSHKPSRGHITGVTEEHLTA